MMAKQINSKVWTDQYYIGHLVSVLPDRYKPTVQLLLKDSNVDIDEIEDATVEYDEFGGEATCQFPHLMRNLKKMKRR